MMRIAAFLISLLILACGNDQSAEKQQDAAQQSAAPSPEASDIQASPTDEQVPAETESTAPSSAADIVGKTAKEMPAAPETTAPLPAPKSPKSAFSSHGFTDISQLDPSIRLDIKYATADNFTKSKIYDCPRCLLRPESAEAVVTAHKFLKKKGLALKMFDCYRPRPYQQRLWDKVPNPNYVTPPAKGSMHSRGAAVDLTIVDANGKELDMGTPYDFFGREAHTDNKNLPQKVLTNRQILREAMEMAGFKGIRTEWWHFSYQKKVWPLSDYVWPCDK